MTTREYRYPVWGTQGGGLVREVKGVYIFVEKPDCPGLDVGDEMPSKWGIIPANNQATKQMENYEFGCDYCGSGSENVPGGYCPECGQPSGDDRRMVKQETADQMGIPWYQNES